MARIIDYCTAPVQKRRVSITDEMADNVREILGREMTADDVAREFDHDQDVKEVVCELIAEEVETEEEPYPGWAMGLGISAQEWSEHYEDVDRAMRVKRKFAAKRAALTADFTKKMEKLDAQERNMMPLWSPKSKLIREITTLVYKGLGSEEITRLDDALNDLKLKIRESQSMPPIHDDEKLGSSAVEYVESVDTAHMAPKGETAMAADSMTATMNPSTLLASM